MRVTVIGTGYVGLVTATCLAESGNHVIGVDIDEAKIRRLIAGDLPIYEPGLLELLQRNLREERLSFTTDLTAAVEPAQLIFVAVGTPQGADGAADLSAVWSVSDQIAACVKGPKILIIKSTVPVGTNRALAERLAARTSHLLEVVSNPEFLKEGAAVEDFMKPDRVVVGVRRSATADVMRELYSPFLRTEHPFLAMTPESAEMTKYVANCMLATKISFINEMAILCEKLGADINEVRRGIGHDARIGFQFLFPGLGYGGSCFPKDVRAVISMARGLDLPVHMMEAVERVNNAQKCVLFEKIHTHFSRSLLGTTIAVWGLAFKPRTDDIREAPSLVLLNSLLAAGARVQVHDPAALANIQAVYGDRMAYFDRPYGALEGADALAVVTEWQEFRQPDFDIIRRLMRTPVIFDGRNVYDPQHMARLGFTYYSIGREPVNTPVKSARSQGQEEGGRPVACS